MSPPTPPHVPVMLDRVVGLLADAPDGVVVDATLGAAGHAAAVAEARIARYGRAHLVGIDRDPEALELATDRLSSIDGLTVDLFQRRFDALGEVLDDVGIDRVAGILLDLGISSMHVDRAPRGFSYRQSGPLDMRMGPDAPRTAAELIAESSPDELAVILTRWGDERFARRIARAVKQADPAPTTTVELAEIVRSAIPAAARRTGGHPATRTFQALRIAVNAELDALANVLPEAIARLQPGGVAVALAYHSLEDRLVKRAFTDAATGCICPPDLPVCACGRVPDVEHIVRRPERPDEDEITRNPRASAARLRAVARLPETT